MKLLRCRDIGKRECNFLAEGRSLEEVERKMLDHEQERHAVYIESMSIEERGKLLEQMDAMVEDR